jgi:hypothetical protein
MKKTAFQVMLTVKSYLQVSFILKDFTALNVSMMVFAVVILCGLVNGYQLKMEAVGFSES